MATIEDSNKLTIYKGNDTDYAFIPLDVNEGTYYDFANCIIHNDASMYMKNITYDSNLYKLIKHSIIDVSAIRDDTVDSSNYTISITDGTYNINGYLSNKMLTHIIKLYYIENFKYTLDVSQYTISNDENIDTSVRGNTYMFTITPQLTDDDIKNIEVGVPTQSGGGSGSEGGDTSSGETTDPNKKYNIIFNVNKNSSLTLERVGNTNNYKLTGTLVIKYRQSDDTIKNDKGTQIPINYKDPIISININNISYSFKISKINNGYNETTKLWEGEIELTTDEQGKIYTLIPGVTYYPIIGMSLNKDDISYFTYRGVHFDNYIGEGYFDVNDEKYYKFKLNSITASNSAKLNAYFLQPKLGWYTSWEKVVSEVMKTSNNIALNKKVSGIFIIISDNIILNNIQISQNTSPSQPSGNSVNNKFKVSSTAHNSIFTSDTDVELDGPPIFLYDENQKQSEIQDHKLDSSIFNETYFKYKSGNRFTAGSKEKNIINLNNYKLFMYKYADTINTHYCGTQLSSNTDLSLYADKGKIFNVVYEVWSVIQDFQSSINTPIKNGDGEYILKTMRPIDKLDPDNPTIKPFTTYTETVNLYKLYSFKLSKTDPSTGIYEYTYVD